MMTEDASSIPRFMVCPYCGSMHKDHLPEICEHCHGRLDPESREHTRADLGPWFVRSVDRPFSPGMRFETLVRQMGLGRIRSTDVVRGPTTSQFWTVARKVPGLSHHFGLCHACQAPASAEDEGCRACGVSFRVSLDRDRMGLGGDGAQTSAFGDTANVRSMPQQSVSPSEDAAAESSVPTEELNSRTSTQLRRELLAARRRQNALHWLVGALVLGVLGLLVLQELKSPLAPQLEPPAPPAPTPAPNPSKSIPKVPSCFGLQITGCSNEGERHHPQKPPVAPTGRCQLKTTNCLWTTHCVCISVRLIPAEALKPGKQNWVVSKSNLSRWLHPPLPNERRSGRPSRTWFVKQSRICRRNFGWRRKFPKRHSGIVPK